MQTSKLIYLMIVMHAINSKAVSGMLKDWIFTNNHCFIMTRYGSKTGVNIEVEVKAECNPSMHANIMVVDEIGHRMIDRMAIEGVPDIAKVMLDLHGNHVDQHVLIDLAKNDPVSLKLNLSNKDELYYYYICDHDLQINAYYKQKLDVFRSQLNSPPAGESEGITTAAVDRFQEILHACSDISYRLQLTNGSSHHHSSEEDYVGIISLVFTVVYSVLAVEVGCRLCRAYKTSGQLDHPVAMLMSVAFMQFCSTLFKSLHALQYSPTGQDWSTLDVLNRGCYVLADGGLCLLLLLMTKGYGVAQIHLVLDFELELVVGVVLLALRYVWVFVLYYRESDSHDLFHMYDGWLGILELLNLAVFYSWFLGSLAASPVFQKDKLDSLKKTIFKVGSLYFLLRPVMLLTLLILPQGQKLAISLTIALVSHAIPLVCAVQLTTSGLQYKTAAISRRTELFDR